AAAASSRCPSWWALQCSPRSTASSTATTATPTSATVTSGRRRSPSGTCARETRRWAAAPACGTAACPGATRPTRSSASSGSGCADMAGRGGEHDVIVVGAGLAGLVAATTLADAGRRVLLLEREGEQDLGGQAWWSFGGLFLVDTPEQRRLGVRDSVALARQDWFGSAGFEGADDTWPRRWAEAYLQFAAGEKREWLRSIGVKLFPVVGWAERGDGRAEGHGNSVPRFHITWGTGPGIVEPFLRSLSGHRESGRITLRTRHAVEELLVEEGRVVG